MEDVTPGRQARHFLIRDSWFAAAGTHPDWEDSGLPVEEDVQDFKVDFQVGVAVIGKFDVDRGDALHRRPINQLAREQASRVDGWVGVIAHRCNSFRQTDRCCIGRLAAGKDSQRRAVVVDQREDILVDEELHQRQGFRFGGRIWAAGNGKVAPAAIDGPFQLPLRRKVTVQNDTVFVRAPMNALCAGFPIRIQGAKYEQGSIIRDPLGAASHKRDQLFRECDRVVLVTPVNAPDDQQLPGSVSEAINFDRAAGDGFPDDDRPVPESNR